MNKIPHTNWYQKDRKFLQAVYGNDADLFAALLSACSPQVHVKISWDWANRIYRDYKANRYINYRGLLKCHIPNVKRALAGEKLSGRKVQNFYANLTGDLNAVTLDSWMLRFFGWFDRHKRTPTNRQYDRLVKRFVAIAKANGLKPAELQSAIWIKYRQENGFKPVSYSVIGADKKQMAFNFEPAPF